MGLTVQFELKDDQLEALKQSIIKDLKRSMPDYGKRKNPYTIKEFAKIASCSERTVRNRVAANIYTPVPGSNGKLILASEGERFFG